MTLRTLFFTFFLFVSSQLLAQQISLAKTNFTISESIDIPYTDIAQPSNSEVYIINIVPANSADNGLDKYKYVRDFPAGTVNIWRVGYDGNYEVRLLKYKSGTDTNPAVLQRIAFTVGKPLPPMTKSCNTALPKIVGKATAGAPTVKQITDIIRGLMAEVYTPLGKEPKDVCIEFGPLRYLPKSKVKLFSQWENPSQAALPAWPVKMDVTVKIPKGDVMEVKKIDSAKETFYFYKDDKGKWNYKAGK